MIKIILEFILLCVLRIALWFRYRVKVKGLEKLTPQNLNKPGGTLFLPNHPTVFVDATSITIALWPKFRLRPMVVEYMYYLPFVNSVLRFLDALPVPNFATSSNSLKRKKTEAVIQTVINDLRNKQNFLIFPAGKTKQTAIEAVDGASAVHRILQEAPETNVVLVRVKGLWGSSFSRALVGHAPPFFPTVFQGFKYVLKNLLFFTPRREVIIEFELAPPDFPYHVDRLEFNRWLERWYNRPDGLKPQTKPYPGDSLILVSYSVWRNEYPQLAAQKREEDNIQIDAIPKDIQDKVVAKVTELVGGDPDAVTPDMTLTTDLGMDSLDAAEMAAFLQDQYDVGNVNPEELTTVGKVMAIAAKQIVCEETKEELEWDISQWKQTIQKARAQIAKGETIPEVFLRNCDRMGHAVACGDMRSGVVTYQQLKLRVIVLAEHIRRLPGEYIGILLPASVAASMAVLACQLAGKAPMMINWTIGPRHLQSMVQLSQVKTILSSWSFLDRLPNVDLTGVEDLLVMLEDLRRDISLTDRLKGFIYSKFSAKTILRSFNIHKLSKDATSVLLFTSGTENAPKGVPLSHDNILSNQRAYLEALEIYSNDVIFGILPPFHSFGFTVTGITGLLSGVKVAYSPDPTDGRRLAENLERWSVTVMCATPTFVKGMLKVARPEQLKMLRLCCIGAEKMPYELAQAMSQLDAELLEGYGVTECSPVLTFTRSGKERRGVGSPLPGIELCVVDLETHAPLSKGQQGLILASGPNVFKGYLNPGQSSPFVVSSNKNWYITGDIGYLDNEGNLILAGRLKRFVKVGGEMISLVALEEVFQQAALKKGWLRAKEDGPILAICAKEIPGEKPKISLYCRFSATIDEANKALKEAGFSNLVKITSVVQLKEIPITGTGKINYRKLEETMAMDGNAC